MIRSKRPTDLAPQLRPRSTGSSADNTHPLRTQPMWDAMTETYLDPLALLAERAALAPDTLAHALALHRARYGSTPSEQRRHLGVRVEDWPAFQLCGMPETADELQALAGRFGCHAERLGRALRAGE